MSLAEMLCAVLILLLASGGMTAGIGLAQKSFVRSLRSSEAQELSSTLESLLTNEFRYTSDVTLNGDTVLDYRSVVFNVGDRHVKLVSVDENNYQRLYGELSLLSHDSEYGDEYYHLLSSAAYSKGLGANACVSFNRDSKVFTIVLKIADAQYNVISEKHFDVRALNITDAPAESDSTTA